ncbi:SDR family oxidoreductase [bacterium]|nr:SDR family oxidoreductase [bacterium]
MEINFLHKKVLITGGTKGIGKTLVEAFYSRGACVYTTGTDKEMIDRLNKQNEEKGESQKKYYYLDLTIDDSVKQLEKSMSQERLDVLVNNAGVNRIDSIDEIKDEDWDWLNTVNLRGAYLMTKLVSQKMKRQRYGRIVNISSIWGVVGKEKRAAYSSTKWGVIGLTKAVALDLGAYNVLVNSVSPGFVDTELTRRILSEEEIKQLSSEVPLKRLAGAEEIAKVVMFLASDHNTYITSQNIVVDGGFTSR